MGALFGAQASSQSSSIANQAQQQENTLFDQASIKNSNDRTLMYQAMLKDQSTAQAGEMAASKMIAPNVTNPLALVGLSTIHTGPYGDPTVPNLGRKRLLGG